MKKIVLTCLAVVILLGAGVAFNLNSSLKQITVTRVTEDLHMISSEWGGNVAVLRTGAGSVVVDTLLLEMHGEMIREKAQELTGEPVVMIINSHYHLDHTHGNPAFEPGTRVVSSERTLHHLQQLDQSTFSGAAAELLPNETFAADDELVVGDKTIRFYLPGRGHTDGDLAVLFVEDRTLHTGDLFFNKHYPNIDLEAGGSVQVWGDTLDNLFDLPFDHIMPGHGVLASAEDMRQFQAFIRQLAALGSYAASIDGILEDTLVNGRLTEDEGYVPIEFGPMLSLNREFVITRAWEEATGSFELYEGY